MFVLSMKRKLILLGVIPSLIIILVLVVFSTQRMKTAVDESNALWQAVHLDAHKNELRHTLEAVNSLIKPLYDKSSGDGTPEKAEAVALLQRVKYGDDGYIFGYDGVSVQVFQGDNRSRIGTTFMTQRDANGVYFINELIKLAKAGGGYLTYHYPRPGADETPQPKLSYAIWLPKWNMMIGTGVYVDSIDAITAKAKQQSDTLINKTQQMMLFFAGILLIGIGVGAYLVAQKTVQPLNELAESLENIAKGGGDLTRRLPLHAQDEVGAVTQAFNRFVDSIHSMISRIQSLSLAVADIGEKVAEDTKATVNTLDSQRDHTMQVVSAMDQIASSAAEVARSTQSASSATDSAEQSTKAAQKTAERSIENIHLLSKEVRANTDELKRLQDDVNGIGAVSDVIRDIAEQTNLLALNASIEAARAGDLGRGFAVVADEVRALAGRTQASTQEIQAMIQRLQHSTSTASESIQRSLTKGDTSVQMVLETSQALSTIDKQVSTVNQQGMQIAAAAEEQTQVIESMSKSMHIIAQATDSASQYAAHSYDAVTELGTVGNELKHLVAQFKT